jgi:starch synthase
MQLEVFSDGTFALPFACVVRHDRAEISLSISNLKERLSDLELLLHWSKKNTQGPWTEELISPDFYTVDDSRALGGSVGGAQITFEFYPHVSGFFCWTATLRERSTKKTVAGTHLFGQNAECLLQSCTSPQDIAWTKEESDSRTDFAARLTEGSTTEAFVNVLANVASEKKLRGVGRVLLESIGHNDVLKRRCIRSYPTLRKKLLDLGPGAERDTYASAFMALQSFGLGEIVLVSPEGFHAEAGGLARVIKGLSELLADAGVPVTVISPFYEEAKGSSHLSAKAMLKKGLRIREKNVSIDSVGEVDVYFGPVRRADSPYHETPAHRERVGVYEANDGLVRVFLLRHPTYASTLYPAVNPQEAIERAVFLSRGALEVLREQTFAVTPQVIVTNDWLTGLIPAYLALDSRFSDAPRLRRARTVHVIHNSGKAYQGRFPTRWDGRDLWPLLGLSGEHYWGIADPHDEGLLNLSAAALTHVRSGILAVSKKYAEELLTREGGDGLETLFHRKEHILYGISNAVDIEELRASYQEIGRANQLELGTIKVDSPTTTFLKSIAGYKKASKSQVCKNLGLSTGRTVLFSLLGRLVEQKGIGLLSAPRKGYPHGLLEYLFEKYPEFQLIVAGPLSESDSVGELFRQQIEALRLCYPGRLHAEYEFLPHRRILELTMASDFFLMPSRYEPGGISQLEALASGTLVVARNVGGIAATLLNYKEDSGKGNAFLFNEYTEQSLLNAMERAIALSKQGRQRTALMRRALSAANDWKHRLPQYQALFQHVTGVLRLNEEFPFLRQHCHLVERLRPGQGFFEPY